MSSESFFCKLCHCSFPSQDLLTAHNRFLHLKKENISSVQDEFEVSMPGNMIELSISNVMHKNLIDVKQEFISTESVGAESTSNANHSGITYVLNQNHLHVNSLQEWYSLLNTKKGKNQFIICSKCNIKYESLNALVSHYKLHIKQKDVEGLEFDTFKFYSLTQEPQRCNICDLSFCDIKEKRRHFQHVHYTKLKCCGKYFPKTKTLFDHIKNLHAEKCVRCDMCPKVFVRNKDLNKHYKTHIGVKHRYWYMTDLKPVTLLEKDPGI